MRKRCKKCDTAAVPKQNSPASFFAPATIQRKMQVAKPDDKIPNPSGKGVVQTNGDTVISYLNEICKDAHPSIASGIISVDNSFCSGTATGADGKPQSKIQQSKTPAGCSCICDMVNSPHTFKIVIDDTVAPNTSADDRTLARTTGTGATITVGSPNGKTANTLSQSGNVQTIPPWLVLAHELCGHSSFINKGKSLDDYIGNAVTGRGDHTATVTIENKIRAEHAIEARGTHRDPCCGGDIDGLFMDTTATTCKDFLKTAKAQKMLKDRNTVLFECKKWRDEYNQLNGTSFTLEDAVPEKAGETKPAEYRYDIYFNKDMPQSWFNPAASFAVSTTEDGKAAFGEASRIIELRKDIKAIQVEGYASSDKPAGDPDYNTRLAERRVNVVKNELLKKGADASQFISFQPAIPGKTCTGIGPGAINCSDTESNPKAVDPKDRRVVIRFTKF